MTNQIEAMKAALGAVQQVIDSDRGKNFLNPADFHSLVTAKAELTHALSDAALDKMADNARELGIGLHDCDHDWKYIGSKRQAMWECTQCGMYKVRDEQPAPVQHQIIF